MEDRRWLRRTAVVLRAAGLALICASTSAGALAIVLPAAAGPWATLTNAVAAVAVRPPAVSSPSPAPAPAGPRQLRGGPITFAMTGSLSLGQTQQTQTTGSAASGTQFSTSSSNTLDNAGMMAQIERRTSSTTLQFGLPMSVALRRANLGQMQGAYYTPKMGFIYGGQPLSLLGGVPLGQTQLGFSVVLPLHGGDISVLTGPAFGPNQQTFHLFGVRARTLVRSTLVEFGLDTARANDGTTVSALVLGAGRSSGALMQSFETAIERSPNMYGTGTRGYSYQYSANYGAGHVDSTFSLRRISNGFLSFGSGALLRDDFAGGSVRTTLGSSTFDIEEAIESSGSGDAAITSRRSSFTYSQSFERLGIENILSFTDQHRRSAAGVDWTGGIGEQVGFDFDNIGAEFGAQYNRASLSYARPIGLITYNGELQRQFGLWNVTGAYQNVRQTGITPALQALGTFSVTRTFGSTGITLGLNRTHILNSLDDVVQTSPTLTVARRLSPSATLAVTYGLQSTRDLSNPDASGKSRIFSVQLAAPFAIGNGIVQGRIDPRLPASIYGSVVSDTNSNQYSFASTLNSGMGNVVVVLDDKEQARTDLAGHYQFSFVQPGVHEVRLETTSLPHGVTADQPYASVTVMGGQKAQVSFRIGTYGVVVGHVFGRDASGAPVPIDNVTLELDGVAYSHTSPLGAYSFGRLSAGTHTVSIEESSLPASVFFAKDALTQKIAVRNGESSRLDFQAAPLGSISGMVTFDRSLAPVFSGAVNNAYVVAEPGDYSAITNDDGSFILDNIPSGQYTLNLDPETLPDGTGNASGPVAIALDGTGNKDGVSFIVGKQVKAVVFSFKTTQTRQATLTMSEPALPPLGAAQAIVDAGTWARSVTVTILGKAYRAAYDAVAKRWAATIVVPHDAPDGKIAVTADVQGQKKSLDTSAAADLTIEGSLPLAALKVTPARHSVGQYVTVHARFLADVRPGDTIRWLDGQITKLDRPLTGRLYVFSVKISVQRMRGLLLTRQGQVPIILR